MMKYIRTVISILLCLTASWGVQAGQIFVTGHDPIWHSKFDPLPDGARDPGSALHAGCRRRFPCRQGYPIRPGLFKTSS